MNIDFPTINLLPHQKVFWQKWVNNNISRTILIWHRRAGKDIISFLAAVERAIIRPGLYWYIFPNYAQAKKSFWEAFFDNKLKYIDLIPKQLVKSFNNVEMKITLINNSIIRFVGGDNPDSLVGSNPNGVVISEYALQKPSLWELILEPILLRNKGWCIFNSTPRGENHCYDMYNYLKEESKKNKNIIADLQSIETTLILSKEDIQSIRNQGRPEELIQQEYYCSFAGALTGSYYSNILTSIALTNIKKDLSYNGEDGVQTLWDLGISDETAIWWVVVHKDRIDVLDYYENSGYGLGHYAAVIQSKKYNYICHNLPHDGAHRTMTATDKAQTVAGQLITLGLNKVNIIPRTKDLIADIMAVRGLLNKCYFDKDKCKNGLDCLKNYHREYDENRKCYKDTPCHDWSSHGADAFRILPFIFNKHFINSKHTPPKKWKSIY